MKIRQNLSIFPLLIMGVFLVLASSCEKDDDSPIVFNTDVAYSTMTDQEGNVYKTVTIGTQTWMAENLRTTKYNDGTAIPNVTDGVEWGALTTGAYCNYKNTTSKNEILTYGQLYNWYAINTGKVCPTGWHVPSDAEWTKLITYLGGENLAGDKLKEIGTGHWHNSGPNNSSGFTALPGGGRGSSSGLFGGLGYQGEWWSATESDASYSWSRYMTYDLSTISISSSRKWEGKSVRCVRD